MNKKVVICACDQCPYFDNEYFDYNEVCRLLKRKIERVDCVREIPTDCPLQDSDEQIIDEYKIKWE